jgi:hypothetical protein
LKSSPDAEYRARIAAREAAAERLQRREDWISRARLATFAVLGALAWLALGKEAITVAWSVVPLVAFGLLVVAHWDASAARRRARAAAAWYRRGLTRLDGTWPGGGMQGDRFRDPRHPYADDLDLFGEGSLFELLCTARTRAGEETLAAWLRAPADDATVRARQEAVAELRERLDLREELALLGGDVRGEAGEPGVDADALRHWAVASDTGRWPRVRPLAALLAVLAVASVVAWAAGFGLVPLIVVSLLESAVVWAVRHSVAHTVRAVERPSRDLAVLGALLGRIERETFTAPRLVTLRRALDGDGPPPSVRVGRLRRAVDLLDARRNQLFAPIAWLLMWTTQLAAAIETWRRASGPLVPRWLEVVGEIEALAALATFAWERPEARFPEPVPDAPCFDGRALVHPLLPPGRAEPNDVRLDGGHQVLVLSGSNMSGKSTLLRTVGTAAVLAHAGAPVTAGALRISPLVIGASIRINDSLLAGTSRFYAEIERLKQIVDLAGGEPPLLFLLDEVLHGTNSHDRRVGAEAVVRGLVGRGAIGIVTTHDLALAAVADALAPRASNVHFTDELCDGRLRFDYRLRPGVVTHGNALALMRAVGLEV